MTKVVIRGFRNDGPHINWRTTAIKERLITFQMPIFNAKGLQDVYNEYLKMPDNSRKKPAVINFELFNEQGSYVKVTNDFEEAINHFNNNRGYSY
jgi:hypothetical protein